MSVTRKLEDLCMSEESFSDYLRILKVQFGDRDVFPVVPYVCKFRTEHLSNRGSEA